MEAGGETEGAKNSLKTDVLEVSVTVEDLKLLLGRLGDLEDPYFKHLEVILWNSFLSRVVFGKRSISLKISSGDV